MLPHQRPQLSKSPLGQGPVGVKDYVTLNFQGDLPAQEAQGPAEEGRLLPSLGPNEPHRK